MTPPDLIFAMDRIGMTVSDLARIVGRSERMIHHYRRGRYPIPVEIALIVSTMRDGEISIEYVTNFIKG